MASPLAPKCSRVDRSLFWGLSNCFPGSLSTSPEEMSRGNIFSRVKMQPRAAIQMGTILKGADNSGARKVMCIQPPKGKKGAKLGDTIVATVKEADASATEGGMNKQKGRKDRGAQNVNKVAKSQIVHAVVVRAAMQRGRHDGTVIKFDDNAVVLVDEKGQPIGSRVFGPVPRELRNTHPKIVSLASEIV